MINLGTAKLTKIDPQALVGKTIAEVKNAVNVLLIEFSDGTNISIHPRHEHNGLNYYEINRMEEVANAEVAD